MTNIEKSAFRRGEYVGYAAGLVWHIRKEGRDWLAMAQGTGIRIVRVTLRDVSIALENVII
tara:strand:+ start:627 stop:809 length:183 start_codon:yes stop_codon:yes gene_type:complete